MKRNSRTGVRGWTHAVEHASLLRCHPQEAEAAHRFDALAEPAKRMALVRDVVATRARELTLAYRNVVMVAAGYKSRVGASGVNEVHAEPCVVFIVKRKWAADEQAQAGQCLPQRLLTFGNDGEKSVLYAVPTDVQPADWYAGGSARSTSCIVVDDPQFELPGTLTCGIRLKGPAGAGTDFALSAMHVLSPVPSSATPTVGHSFGAVGAAASVKGRSAAWGGHLDARRGHAFDVQLAEVADAAWFSQAFQEVRLSTLRPYVASSSTFDELAATMRFQILAPANHPKHLDGTREPMMAQFLMMNGGEMPLVYEFRVNQTRTETRSLRHDELIMLRVLEDCPAPESGDSGSPVISWWPDGTMMVVGMFIGSGHGPRERLVYIIPAWHLFDPVNWSRLPDGTVELEPHFGPT